MNRYHASEVEPNAIKICQKNWNDVTEIGDVRLVDGTKYCGQLDLLCGGSPCQNFSFAGTRKGAITKNNIEITTLEQYLELKKQGFEFEGQSYLFWEYVRILKEANPKYFLLENVKMAKKWQDVITNALGVEPIEIDSALVSAQSRKRLYWTNIPNITQPHDKNIYIEDILQTDIEHKYLPKTRNDYANYNKNKVDKTEHKYTATQIGNSKKFGNAIRNNGKAFTLRRCNPNGIIDENWNIRKFTPIECERLQTLPDNYTKIDGLSDNKRWETVGNGWTIDVITHILSFME